MASHNVLHVNTVEEQSAYRTAVARILSNIQHETGDTLLEIAERLDVSLGTISNAANKKCDLSPTFLKRLGRLYGGSMLDPYHALYGVRAVPLEADEGTEALPSLSASVHQLCVATSPTSEGGATITHRELLAALPELRAAQKAITALIVRAEKIAA